MTDNLYYGFTYHGFTNIRLVQDMKGDVDLVWHYAGQRMPESYTWVANPPFRTAWCTLSNARDWMKTFGESFIKELNKRSPTAWDDACRKYGPAELRCPSPPLPCSNDCAEIVKCGEKIEIHYHITVNGDDSRIHIGEQPCD